jgi:hypothetical protein
MENRVASPVKIGEYLSSGLGVVASPWIGDVGEMFKTKSFAFVFNRESTPEEVVKFVYSIDEEKRREARLFVNQYYTYEGNHDVVTEMFK